MPRGGKRPGAGRKVGSKSRTGFVAKVARIEQPVEVVDPNLMPLDYMLAVVRDPNAEWKRRDDLAKAAAPFCHERLTPKENTKREDRQKNAEKSASRGRFVPSAAPKLLMQ